MLEITIKIYHVLKKLYISLFTSLSLSSNRLTGGLFSDPIRDHNLNKPIVFLDFKLGMFRTSCFAADPDLSQHQFPFVKKNKLMH